MSTIIHQKRCCKCTKTKPFSDFNNNRSKSDGKGSECRDCANAYKVKWGKTRKSYTTHHMRMVGFSRKDYDEVWEQQQGKCAICGNPETSRNQYALKKLAVDHDHATGKFRALLCQDCNIKLAALEDIAFVSAAHEYLNKHGKDR